MSTRSTLIYEETDFGTVHIFTDLAEEPDETGEALFIEITSRVALIGFRLPPQLRDRILGRAR